MKFYFSETPSANVSSVDVIDRKYLKYGSDELQINLLEMGSIKANSNVTGYRYYGEFDWINIFGDKNESKVLLAEVEMHKVEFEWANKSTPWFI